MKTLKKQNELWKIAACVALSSFYFTMLAYPFGITPEGYDIERVLIAGGILFAMSIPVWIINIKREFLSETEMVEKKVAAKTAATSEAMNIGQLAVLNKWLTPNEVKQILYCQEFDGMNFGKVAVKRNFLTTIQVKALVEMQGRSDLALQL
jgi:hypothetical protein